MSLFSYLINALIFQKFCGSPYIFGNPHFSKPQSIDEIQPTVGSLFQKAPLPKQLDLTQSLSVLQIAMENDQAKNQVSLEMEQANQMEGVEPVPSATQAKQLPGQQTLEETLAGKTLPLSERVIKLAKRKCIL